MSLRSRLRSVVYGFPSALARLGVVDRDRGRAAFDLAVPVMATGALRVLLRLSDFLFVGLALGDVGIAALELGFQYYFVPFGLSLALTSGTISVVSRYTGAGRSADADFAIKQSLYLSVLLSVPITVGSWLFAVDLVGLLTDDPRATELGAAYLRIVMLSLAFRFWGMIAARALAGAGDTRTPMYVRSLTLPTNIALNAVLVFGLGPAPRLGVVGAATGTAVANTLSAAIFFALLVSGRRTVRLRVGGKQWDWAIAREIVRVGAPLAGTRLARTFGRFPFLFVLGVLGTEAIAAYAVGRRVILLAMMPAWGYATAASTLVGQGIGRGDTDAAEAYGWATTRIALATQLLVAAALALAARPVAAAFGTESVALTADFVRVFALTVGGYSLSRTMRGGLRGAGDTRWPLYGTLAATYVVRLPVAFAALPVGYAVTVGPLSVAPGLGLGYAAVFGAIVAGAYVKAAVNIARFRSGAWKEIGRRATADRPADPDADPDLDSGPGR